MAARQRAQDRIFNRRRRLVLDKGFDLARNQLQTNLGQCLVRHNVKEEERLALECKSIEKTGEIVKHHQDAELRMFVIERDRMTREPSRVCERKGGLVETGEKARSSEEILDERRPRFMHHLASRRTPVPEFSTLSLFRAAPKRTRNIWEKLDPNSVNFRAALSPTPVLTRDETAVLRSAWTHQHERLSLSRTLPSVLRRKSAPPKRFINPNATLISQEEEIATEEKEGEEEEEDAFISRVPGARRAVTAPPGRRGSGSEVLELRSICRDVESVAILQAVIRSGSRNRNQE